MAIVDFTTEEAVPHEEGERFTFRQLNWKQLERAKRAATNAVLENAKMMGGEVFKELSSLSSSDEDSLRAQTAADPLMNYDRSELLFAGVVDWTYKAKVRRETLDALDETTADWAARRIYELSKPLDAVAEGKS